MLINKNLVYQILIALFLLESGSNNFSNDGYNFLRVRQFNIVYSNSCGIHSSKKDLFHIL